LGKYCGHAYAHATNEGAKALPAILKGSDMIAYEVFRSLGVSTYVRPVLGVNEEAFAWYHDDEERDLDINRIGKKLSGPVMTEYGCGDAGLEEIFGEYPHEVVKVKWLNDRTMGTQNMQFGYVTVSTNQTRPLM
jgi:hypothetical protein